MLREGVAIGVLILTRSEARPFTDKQIELVATFADQAAIAIENVRLFDEIQDKRILVVEDQPDNRQIIRDMLAGTDYEITEAEDGEHALAAVAKQRPHLILMGVQLPIIDGYEVTRRIKADPALRSILIIAVTSHALNGEERTA
jgi:two-component system cell cycle response regulator DivK